MSLAPAKQSQQLRAATYGPQLFTAAQSAPTGSTTLWNVSGGVVGITSVQVVVTTAMSGTATTLNIGCMVAGSASATALLNAGVLTSLGVGAELLGIPVLSSPGLGSVLATVGPVTWIATAANTGACQVYLSYIPLTPGATVS
jgi:hypothetical protein